MKKIVSLLVLCILVSVAYLGYSAVSFLYFPNGNENETVIFEVPPGSVMGGVSKRLHSEGLISSLFMFKLYTKITGQGSALRVGEYELNKGMSPHSILAVITSGVSRSFEITFQEGLNIYEIADIIAAKGLGSREAFLKYCQSRTFINKVLGFEAASLEGYLFPETYQITKYTNMEALITMMVNRFFQIYKEIPDHKSLTRHEVVTLASIIEKETGAGFERPIISSVFHNRLQKKMRLQSDPTIIYGIASQTGKMIRNIKKKDIKAPTEYNTYTVRALPKGPIANPGREALLATVKPQETDYFYFVSKNDGTHVFTKTYKEHALAVQKFQMDQRSRKGKSWRDLKK